MISDYYDDESMDDTIKEAREYAERLNSAQEEREASSKRRFLVWQDEQDSTLNKARRKFLETVREVTPQVLASLHGDVLPLYQPIYAACGSRYLTRWRTFKESLPNQKLERLILERVRTLAKPVSSSLRDVFRENVIKRRKQFREALSNLMVQYKDNYEYGHTLHNSLESWSIEHNLTDDWCLDYALQTLALWSDVGMPEELDWQYLLGGVFSFELAQPFALEYRAWKPEVDTWSSYRHKLDKAYKKARDTYHKELNTEPQRKRAYKCATDSHFKWLVKFQIEQLSAQQILDQEVHNNSTDINKRANYIGDDTKTVRKAINDLAKLIVLSLPEDGISPGRPALKKKSERKKPSK